MTLPLPIDPCDPYRALVRLRVMRLLNPKDAVGLDEHLEQCEDCGKYLRQLTVMSHNIAVWREPDGNPPVP